MKKRILGLALALVMIISLLPMTAFAENTGTRAITLMAGVKDAAGNECHLDLDGTNGTVYYTKNKAVKLKDSTDIEFDGWVQEKVTITDEEAQADEWNLKFYVVDDHMYVVLKDAKLDAFNDETGKSVSGAYPLKNVVNATASDITITVLKDSHLGGQTLVYGYGSNDAGRWTMDIVVEDGATLYGKTSATALYAQRSIDLKGNVDMESTGTSGYFAWIGGDRADRNTIQITGDVNLKGFKAFARGTANYPLNTKLNGGSITLTDFQQFGHESGSDLYYNAPVVKDGLCYKYTDANGNPITLATLVDGDAKLTTYEAHTVADCSAGGACLNCGANVEAKECVKAKDDGNCTTAINCVACGKEIVPAKTGHIAGTVVDCTKNTPCGNEGCTQDFAQDAKQDHEGEADDGDCTTPINCKNCQKVVTPGAANHTGGTATCTKKAVCAVCQKEYGELAAHTPKAGEYACNEAHPCANPDCNEPYRPAGTHVGGGAEATCQKKAVCGNCGEEYGELAACTPEADDGDCTTAIKCSVCGKETKAAETAHKYTDKNDTTCDNADCTNTRKVEGTENPKTGDNTALVLCLALMMASAAAFVCTKKFAR